MSQNDQTNMLPDAADKTLGMTEPSINGQMPAQIPPTMMPGQGAAQNPLDQLRDIHLPGPVDQFLFAPGWLVVFLLIFVLFIFAAYRFVKKRKALRLLKPAFAELDQLKSLKQEQISAKSVFDISALLKRICLIYFPQDKVANLSGKGWVSFLNQQCGGKVFSDADIDLICYATYQSDPQIDQEAWQHLLNSSRKCIDKIIRDAAKKPRTSQNKTKVSILKPRSESI